MVLEEALQRYSEHYDLAPFGCLTLDRTGIIREINQTACRLLGAERPVILGTSFRSLLEPWDRPTLTQHLTVASRSGSASSRVRVVPRHAPAFAAQLASRRAGGVRECYPTALLEEGERDHGQPAEDLFAVARSALDRVGARGHFLALVSHELRNPLTPILAAVSALERLVPEHPQIAELCAILGRNVQLQARLIDDLLDASRLSRGKMAMERAPLDLHAVVREAADAAAVVVAQRRLRLKVELAAAQHQVEADPVRLRQLFANLLNNAAKFTPEEGSITVSSWSAGGLVAVEVRDTGAGLSPEVLPRLFTAFEQGTRSPGSHGGLGLGLSICKGIAELHGGRISASSAGVGQGSRFVVELPLLQSARHAGNGQSQARILLVEDNPDTAEALGLALAARGYHVDRVDSVRAALEADLGAVDLVLSDLRLPDGDGRAMLRQLRQREPVPAIVLSGDGRDQHGPDETGVVAHLTKPIAIEQLTEAIERALATRRP